MSVSSWEPDPTGRHQYRWWDGEVWTDQVADDGVQAVDAISDSEANLPFGALPSVPPPPPGPGDSGITSPSGRIAIIAGRPRLLASPLRRLGARIIDSIILLVPSLIIVGIALSSDNDDQNLGRLLGLSLVGALIGFLYEVTLVAIKGQTLGKMATDITIVRGGDGRVPGWGKATGRWAIPTLLSIIPYVGWVAAMLCYLSLTWDRDHQGWHDKAARTYVIDNNWIGSRSSPEVHQGSQ